MSLIQLYLVYHHIAVEQWQQLHIDHRLLHQEYSVLHLWQRVVLLQAFHLF